MMSCPIFVTTTVMVDFPAVRTAKAALLAEKLVFDAIAPVEQFQRPLTPFDREQKLLRTAGKDCNACLVSRTTAGEHTRTYGIAIFDDDSTWNDAALMPSQTA